VTLPGETHPLVALAGHRDIKPRSISGCHLGHLVLHESCEHDPPPRGDPVRELRRERAQGLRQDVGEQQVDLRGSVAAAS